MRNPVNFRSVAYLALTTTLAALYLGVVTTSGKGAPRAAGEGSKAASKPRTVKGAVQVRPGGPQQEVEVAVHPVPVDLPSVPAAEARLKDDELVLGVVVGGRAMAYPIRYLAMYEVVDDRVGDTPLAPTW